VVREGIVRRISGSTVRRVLQEDAIRPWQHRTWIYPRDPDFLQKAEKALDLYEGLWKGKPLGPKEYVLSSDEKTSIQARARIHQTLAPAPERPMRVEHEYERRGALAYLAAWDVHRGKVLGRCEGTTGIEPFHRLIEQIMSQEPYVSAERVFLVIDNGSSHRGKLCVERIKKAWPKIVPVHLPIHASWLNQVEIYFSVIQRKVLTPNDFNSLEEVEKNLLEFQKRYEETAKPFEWKFTRNQLKDLLEKLEAVTVT
jgi:transposase